MRDYVLGTSWNTHAFRSIVADADKLAIGHCNGQVTIWAIPEGDHILTLEQHTTIVKTLKFVPNNRLVSVCNGDLVCVWNLNNNADDSLDEHRSSPICTEMITYSLPVGIPPRGTHAAIASVDRSITHTAHGSHLSEEISIWLWALNGQEEGTPDNGQYASHFDGHDLPVTSIAFSDDGTKMASCSFDRSVRIWDVFTGKCQDVLEGHEHHVVTAQFSPDGRTLVSKSYNEFRLWNVA
jgi:WD40 repeat protein